MNGNFPEASQEQGFIRQSTRDIQQFREQILSILQLIDSRRIEIHGHRPQAPTTADGKEAPTPDTLEAQLRTAVAALSSSINSLDNAVTEFVRIPL